MAEFDFPTKRFQEVEATESEIAKLTEDFYSGDSTIQRSLSDFYASLSEAGIRDFLATRRAENYFQAVSDGVSDDAESTSDVLTTKKDEIDADDFDAL